MNQRIKTTRKKKINELRDNSVKTFEERVSMFMSFITFR